MPELTDAEKGAIKAKVDFRIGKSWAVDGSSQSDEYKGGYKAKLTELNAQSPAP